MSEDKPGPLINGNIHYSEYLKNLKESDYEAYEAHLAEKTAKRTLKKLMEARVEKDALELSEKIFKYATSMLEENRDNPVVFNAIMDRFVGKPKEEMDINTNAVSLPMITISKQEE